MSSERTRDHNNFDYLAVSVKSDQLNRILQCYRALGWKEIKTEDDREYYNMKYVRLVRPHKIQNKDRLQYLQVRMESAINSLVEITNRAHMKSSFITSLMVIAAFAFAVLGIWLAVMFTGVLHITGYVSLGICAVLAIASAIVCHILRRKERIVATDRIVEKMRLTQSLIEEAVSLAPSGGLSDGLDEPSDEREVNDV